MVAGPAGASADMVARLISEPLSRELGQPVIVDNKPGAAGAIAMQDLLQAPHDGHTLLVAVNSLVSEVPHIVKLRWDMFKEVCGRWPNSPAPGWSSWVTLPCPPTT